MRQWSHWAQGELDSIRRIGRWRELVAFDGAGVDGRVNGRDIITFASNDYLGLASHPEVRTAAREAIDRWGAGAGASRLVVGTLPVHLQLEAAIADWQQTERALVFPSGFSANLAVLTTFASRDTTIFSDALNHASIIDGCRQSGAAVQVYRHGDVDHLHSLLVAASGPAIVVTDSVFSMDGDVAALRAIAMLCVRYGALLVVDEAHAVLGPDLPAIDGLDVIRVGTLSKALGSLGGWVAGSRAVVELLINRGRTFIFTTALSPADTAAAFAALKIYRSAEGDRLRAHLRALVELLRPGHPSPVIPVVLGDDALAMSLARRLLDKGLWVPAIRPPTVPCGTARLRIALSALHTQAMVQQLKLALLEVLPVKEPLHAAS